MAIDEFTFGKARWKLLVWGTVYKPVLRDNLIAEPTQKAVKVRHWMWFHVGCTAITAIKSTSLDNEISDFDFAIHVRSYTQGDVITHQVIFFSGYVATSWTLKKCVLI